MYFPLNIIKEAFKTLSFKIDESWCSITIVTRIHSIMHGTRRNGRRDLDSKASYEYEGKSGSLNLNKEIGTGQI